MGDQVIDFASLGRREADRRCLNDGFYTAKERITVGHITVDGSATPAPLTAVHNVCA